VRRTGQHSTASNAAWNIFGGLSPALLAVALPPILVHSLPSADFGLWAVILQVTAVAAAFGAVAQLAVARFVAVAAAREDAVARDSYVSTAFLLALLLGALLIAVMAVISLHIKAVFPQLPASLYSEAGLCLLLVSAGASAMLPTGVISGQFMGEQRSRVPNSITFLGRLLQGVLVAVAALWTSSLVLIALAHMAGNLAILVVQVLAQHRLAHTRIKRSLVSRGLVRSLSAFSAILLLWQIAAFIINGIDLVVLSRIDFAAVPYFAVAGSASAIFGGVIGSVYNAFIPLAARLHEGGDGERLAAFLQEGLRLGTTFMLMAGIPLVLCCEPLLRLWVGTGYASRSAMIMTILVAALLVRTSVMMYVIVAVASGSHGKAWAGPVFEAGANLGLSIALGSWLGAPGVALGTLASSGIGVAAWLVLDPLRNAVNGRVGWRVTFDALRRPAAVLLPFGLIGLLVPRELRASWSGLVIVSAAAVLLGWFFALTEKDRSALMPWLRHRLALIRTRLVAP